MDKKRQCPETWQNSCYENQCPQFNHPSEDPYSEFHKNNQRYRHMDAATKSLDYDPKATLSVVDQKIHQIQDLVHQIVDRRAQISSSSDEQQQHLITSDLSSIIIQLITTAGSLLPSMNKTLFPNHSSGEKLSDRIEEQHHCIEEHEMKDEDDPDEGENLCPGSYKILQLEREEILAPHTHFCTICGKGFKRDANLRMHMRGHGDEYKTPEALAKPHKELSSEPMLIKRYSCPFVGCKRNKDHNKFQPLKTILCVKNHYKRTHCDKSYTCSRCNKKRFSVIADLKTHEKHCGRDKWLCSCGTTFSRKDKLFGHITLFQGHAPVVPLNEPKGLCENGGKNEVANEAEFGLDFGSCFSTDDVAQGFADVKGGNVDDSAVFFSPMIFDPCNLECFDEFAQAPFDDSESSLSFLLSGSCSYTPKIGERSDSNVLNNLDEQQ